MAYFKFVKAIAEDRPIEVYNFGKMQRDFTYIDDIIEGIVRVMAQPPKANASISHAPYKMYNIGNHTPVELLTFIETIEQIMGKSAQKNLRPMQPGDVPTTFADMDDLVEATGFTPSTPLKLGLKHFIQWYHHYYA